MDIHEKVDQQYKLVERYNTAKEQSKTMLEALKKRIDEYTSANGSERYNKVLINEMNEIVDTLKEIETIKDALHELSKG